MPGQTKTTSILGAMGAFGALSFFLIFAAMHLIQPDLDPLTRFGSEYANGRMGWLMIVGFVLAGLGTMATAFGLKRVLPDARRMGTATGFLMAAGIGFIGSGIFPTDVPLDDGTVGYTFDGKMHAVSGLLLFPSIMIAAFMLAGIFRREEGWGDAARWTRLFAWLHLLGFIVPLIVMIATTETLGLDGLRQRIGVAIMLGWLFALGMWLRRAA